MRDDLGSKGEDFFSYTMKCFLENRGYLFRPVFLGDKHPHIDFYVELKGTKKTKGYFFCSSKNN